MYLIGKWIKQNTDVTVLFSGEGADETFCGYLYLHYAPNLQELEKESRRLVEELPYFRCFKSRSFYITKRIRTQSAIFG